MQIQGGPVTDRPQRENISVPAQGATRRPTGDPAVDEVLGQLDLVSEEPLDAQIEASERVHRVLQGRLSDLGQE